MAKRKQSEARKAARAEKQAAYAKKQDLRKGLTTLAVLLVVMFGAMAILAPKEEEPYRPKDEGLLTWVEGPNGPSPKKATLHATVVAGTNEGAFIDATETVDAPYVGSTMTGGEVEFHLSDLGDSAQIDEASTPWVEVKEETVNVDSYQQQAQVTPVPQVVEEVVVQQQATAPVEVYVEPAEPAEEVQVQTVEKTTEQLDAECKMKGSDYFYDTSFGGCSVVIEHVITDDMVAEEGVSL